MEYVSSGSAENKSKPLSPKPKFKSKISHIFVVWVQVQMTKERRFAYLKSSVNNDGVIYNVLQN